MLRDGLEAGDGGVDAFRAGAEDTFGGVQDAGFVVVVGRHGDVADGGWRSLRRVVLVELHHWAVISEIHDSSLAGIFAIAKVVTWDEK